MVTPAGEERVPTWSVFKFLFLIPHSCDTPRRLPIVSWNIQQCQTWNWVSESRGYSLPGQRRTMVTGLSVSLPSSQSTVFYLSFRMVKHRVHGISGTKVRSGHWSKLLTRFQLRHHVIYPALCLCRLILHFWQWNSTNTTAAADTTTTTTTTTTNADVITCVEGINAPVECYECTTRQPNSQFCADPFNKSHPNVKTAVCKGPCSKLVQRPPNGNRHGQLLCNATLLPAPSRLGVHSCLFICSFVRMLRKCGRISLKFCVYRLWDTETGSPPDTGGSGASRESVVKFRQAVSP